MDRAEAPQWTHHLLLDGLMSDPIERYRRVRSSIPSEVTLVAVSKTRSVEDIRKVYDLGHRVFGENKAQELVEKAPLLPTDIEWHFIGHLQRNKVKDVIPHSSLIHSADSLRLLKEIDKRAGGIGKIQDVLLQIHIADEDAKYGFEPSQSDSVMSDIEQRFPNIRVRGLMGMATNTDDMNKVAAEFQGLKELFDQIKNSRSTDNTHFDILSMGMSGDAQTAVENGSNMVRIGTALFGPRVY